MNSSKLSKVNFLSFKAPFKLYLVTLALEVSGHESPVIVSLIRSVICSIHLEVTKMEWLLVGVAEPVEQREDGGQNLTLLINPTNTGLDGAKLL